MNDGKPHFSSQSCRSRVTCMLPGCSKEVLHFSKHLKNVHAVTSQLADGPTRRRQLDRRRIKSSRDVGELVVNPIQLIRS